MLIVSGECGWCEGLDWFVQTIFSPYGLSVLRSFLLRILRGSQALFFVSSCVFRKSLFHIYIDKLVCFLIIGHRGVYVSRVSS